MEDELRIRVTSQSLLEEVVRTLPLQPQYFEVGMAAEGISLPYSDEEEMYISKCVEKGIIPFSKVHLGYHSNIRLFAPNIFESGVILAKEAAVQGLVRGGRIHYMVIRVSPPAQTGFQKFRDEFLDTMLKNGYQFDQGELWFDTRRHQADLTFGMGGLRLRLNGQIPDQLTTWFNQLSEKYKPE